MAEESYENYFDKASVYRKVVRVDGIPTVVSQVGNLEASKDCIVLLTGNPGLIEFYDVFISRLHVASSNRLPVIGVAQAGHSPVWKYDEETNENYHEANYKGMEEQICHKIAFIKKVIPDDKKLVIIGHSIGAYILLKILENEEINQRVTKGILLFPTIENLKQTPNGRFWDPFSYYLRIPFALTAYLVSFMPMWVKRMAVDWRTKWKGRILHPSLLEACLHCVSFTAINNALYMAESEFKLVNELDDRIKSVIEKNLGKLTFYYGATDQWTPREFYTNMKAQYPQGDIRLCEYGFAHDFVVDSSVEVAHLVWDIISKCF